VAVTGWSMLADLTDLEELRTGQRREGALNGVAALAQTALAALAVWLTGVALSAAGYHGGAHPGTAAQLTIRLLMSVGTAVWLVPGVICCLRYPLTPVRHRDICHYLRTGEGDRAALLQRL
jgi:Na+/melibiose symporter-like transporter